MLVSVYDVRLTHSSQFLPHLRFDLNYFSNSTQMDISDHSRGYTIPLHFTSPSDTPSGLIERYQPIARFSHNFYQSLDPENPSCIECSVSCLKCTDMFNCLICEEGTLRNGFCFENELKPLSGKSLLTSFKYSQGDFWRHDPHIRRNLLWSDLQNPIHFYNASVQFQNGSRYVVQNTTQFYIPRYPTSSHSSFNVSFIIHYSILGTFYEESFAQLNITQGYLPLTLYQELQNSKHPSSNSSLCGCSSKGKCNSTTGLCKCETPYFGHFCSYLDKKLSTLQLKITESMSQLKQLIPVRSVSDSLEDLALLVSDADALTELTAKEALSITKSLIPTDLYSSELLQCLQVLSSLSRKASYQQNTQFALSLLRTLQFIGEQALGLDQDFSVHSGLITIVVATISKIPSSNLQLDSSSSVILPTSLSNSKLLGVVVRAPLFLRNKQAQSHLQSSSSVSINIFQEGKKKEVRDLATPIQLKFSFKNSHKLIKFQLQRLESLNWPPESISCSFYNYTSNSISSDGCSLTRVSIQSVECSCTHLTDFMSFLNTGVEVITQSNYNLWSVLSQITLSSLVHNLGFHLSLAYWSSFLLFLVFFSELDRRKLKNRFFTLMLDSQRCNTLNRADSSKQMLFHKIRPLTPLPYKVKYKRAQSIILPRRATLSSEQGTQRPSLNSINTMRYKIELEQLQNISEPSQRTDRQLQYSERSLKQKPPVRGQNSKSESPKKKKSKCTNFGEVQTRLLNIIHDEQTRSQKFWKLFRFELASNNLPFGLFARTFPLKPRTLRLAVLYLGVLMQIAVCAFFFDLNSEPTSSSLIDKLIQNFWVSLYSVLLTAPLLLLIGVTHSLPPKLRKRLQQCNSLPQLKEAYEAVRRPLKIRTILSWLLFFLISSFLLLYLICFTQVASSQLVHEWLMSSLLSIVLDQFVLEVIPALGVSLLGLVVSSFRRCSALVCLILAIETYRIYRNLISD